MSDTDTPPVEQDGATPDVPDNDETPEGADALGDPGKKALDSMKAKWKAAEARAKEAEQRAADLAAMQDKTAEERAEIERQRETERAVLERAQKMVATTALKAAAKGVLADPSDVLAFVDVADVVVTDDGDVENAEHLISELLERKPHLAAAQRGGRIGGSADAGARKTPPPPSVDEQIAEAQAKGDWRTVISLQNRKLAAAG